MTVEEFVDTMRHRGHYIEHKSIGIREKVRINGMGEATIFLDDKVVMNGNAYKSVAYFYEIITGEAA